MMKDLPYYISLVFILTTILTVWGFYKASHHSKPTLIVLIVWLVLQSIPAMKGFYTVTNNIPPRFALLVLPPFLLIAGLFLTKAGRHYLDRLDAKTLTLLHTIRIPVELVLYWLFLENAIPQLMTFEGRNFDILSGLTAPLAWYFGYVKPVLPRSVLLIWNLVCLGLLINIVVYALFSAPFPFQRFAFDHPNIAVLYFPFNWLPCGVVPIVLLSHLAVIRQLVLNPQKRIIKQALSD